jgi:uncharacterized protein
MELERRCLSMSEVRMAVREDGDKPVLRGYAALFDSWSHPLPGDGFTFRERIVPGAFDAVLADPDLDVIGNYEHVNAQMLGRSSSGTLRLFTDSVGLGFEIDPPNTNLGRDILELTKRGDLRGCSFAFTCSDDGADLAEGADGIMDRSIRQVSGLYDVSIVTTPAYPNTALAVRSIKAWKQSSSAPAVLLATVDRTVVVRARAAVLKARRIFG